MKKRYESPEIEALNVRKEDIITNSYMLPDMPIEMDTDHGEEGGNDYIGNE